ncbi:MAG: serine hydrolase [Pseudomonadota bacterium]
MFAAFIALLIAGTAYLHRIGLVGSGYISQMVCVEHFYNGRSADETRETFFGGYDSRLGLISHNVDEAEKTVSAGIGPLGRSRAVFFDGFGCVIERGPLPDLPSLPSIEPSPLPIGNPEALGFDERELNQALDDIIGSKDGHSAILVMREGQIVAERYADGYDAAHVFPSASMAKSVTATMIAAAIQDGLVDINNPAPIPEWSGEDDLRSQITWKHLLEMQSGLEFGDGDYRDPFGNVPVMNVLKHSAAEFAINKPLLHEPGTVFEYSTGTSNILQHALRNALEDEGLSYHQFGLNQIFEPLGMSSFMFVPDSAGDFIGGSTAYASAHDWAKLGQLYLQDGKWDGEQVLPENWLEYVSTPNQHSDRAHSAQIWLNLPGIDDREASFPSVPEDALMFWGHGGQFVVMIPSLDMLIVHLGWDPEMPMDKVFGRILGSLEKNT